MKLHASRILRWLSAMFVLMGAEQSEGVDLSRWGRHGRHHGNWITVEFRDPLSGLFVAARAGTEDKPNNATLTFTVSPVDNCVPEVVIVLKADAPGTEDSEDSGAITVRIDGQSPRRFAALVVRQRDDPFWFVRALDEISPDDLKHRKSMAVALPDGLGLGFSLEGFDRAWRAINDTCRAFLAP